MTLNRKASLLFLISVSLYLLISLFIPQDLDAGGMLWVNALAVSIPAFLIPALIFRRVNRFPLAKPPRVGHIFIAIALGIGCMFLNLALVCLDSAVTYGIEINSTALDVQESMKGTTLLTMIVCIGVIPAVSEEFMMRGALLETWRRTAPVAAMLLTSLLFGLLHASPSNILIYFAMGMLFAVVYHLTRNVWLTVIIHFMNNLLSVMSAYSVLNSDPEELASAAAEELTRGQYVSYFVSYIIVAAVLIVPLLILLRNSCRKNGIGLYAVKAAEAPIVPEGLEDYPASEYSAVYDEAGQMVSSPAYAGELADDSLREEHAPGKLLADPLLWVSIILLVALNVFAGLIEFGVIQY